MSAGAKFIWAYRKSDSSNAFQFKDDFARIYSINVTNTIDGGAGSCRPCPQGASQDGYVFIVVFVLLFASYWHLGSSLYQTPTRSTPT
jgi:hypothetical protein